MGENGDMRFLSKLVTSYHLLCIVVVVIILPLDASPTGPSSFPYISGDTWRHYVDHVLSDCERFLPGKVEGGDVIFVEQSSLSIFQSLYQPRIQCPYILITANCDMGGDDPIPGKYENVMHDPHLVAWFTQNIDRPSNSKLHPIPIGLANRKWGWGKIELYNERIPEARSRIRTEWVYGNFAVGSNRKVRQPVWDYFSENTIDGWVKMIPFRDHLEYMQEMPSFRFVLCPPGNGLDTHRAWESLLLGCYPIVISSTLNPLYEDLPVLILDKWEDLNRELLEKKYEEFKGRSWNYEKLYFPYWLKQVIDLQIEIRQGLK